MLLPRRPAQYKTHSRRQPTRTPGARVGLSEQYPSFVRFPAALNIQKKLGRRLDLSFSDVGV
jgi:hypothetical protein